MTQSGHAVFCATVLPGHLLWVDDPAGQGQTVPADHLEELGGSVIRPCAGTPCRCGRL